MSTSVLYAALGTGFTFLMTVLGAAIVLVFGNILSSRFEKLFNGFAAGVMMAASVWSLIIPAFERVVASGKNPVFVIIAGIISGIVFLLGFDLAFDIVLSKKRINYKKGMYMSVFAVTLHNIPEGVAVALAFVLAVMQNEKALMVAAVSLAIGIGIQNIPEGAAISIPMRSSGLSKTKSFILGSLSGIVEPIFGIAAVFIFGFANAVLPFMLCFAAGAMIYVVAEELLPNAKDEHSKIGTLGFMCGFLIMMILDISL